MLTESYIANWRNLPDSWVKIRVARPSILSPSKELLDDYKKDKINWKTYKKRFEIEMLKNPSALEEMKRLRELAKKKTVCLICYEKEPPCHRFLLLDLIKPVS